MVHTGLSYMYEPAFNRAILPLLEAGAVDALEWSFDTVKDHRTLPHWMQGLLKEYAQADRLYGHGVYYSIFYGRWLARHDDWLRNLESVLGEYQFRHISEHFGFMTSGNAHEGAPLPIPYCAAALQLGRERLQRLHELVRVPVGIENLALAFSPEGVQEQGLFLEQLVAPIDGFVLLDLHNIYCQAVNFGIDARGLILSYPLHRVREIHVAGGSWASSDYTSNPIRRDTHDEAMPEELHELLQYAIERCPNLELVVLERLGDTLRSKQDEAAFRDSFLRVRDVVNGTIAGAKASLNPLLRPYDFSLSNTSPEDLFIQQKAILGILKGAPDATAAYVQLQHHPAINQSLWNTASWQLPMIETAMALGVKWGIEG